MSQRIPSEIWQEIFKHLEEGSDLKSCSLVCRSWYLNALELLWDDSRIFLESFTLSSFLLYLGQNPDFAQKVKNVEFDNQVLSPNDPEKVSTAFIKVLTICSNLENLNIVLTSKPYYVLTRLLDQNDSTTNTGNLLPRLKRLYIMNSEEEDTTFGHSSLDNNQFDTLCASVWWKWRKTLTGLYVYNSNNSFKGFDQFGGLYQYLPNFPNLQHLRCLQMFTDTSMDIDLPLLIRSNKKLEIVELDGDCRLITAGETTKSVGSMDSRRVMKIIDMGESKSMDLGTLLYIVEELVVDEELTIQSTTIPDDDEAATDIICKSNENPNAVFKQLNDYRKTIKGWVRVGLKCGDLSFHYPPKSSENDDKEEASTRQNR